MFCGFLKMIFSILKSLTYELFESMNFKKNLNRVPL